MHRVVELNGTMSVLLALPACRNPLRSTLLVGPRSGLTSQVPKLGGALLVVGFKRKDASVNNNTDYDSDNGGNDDSDD